jgi:glyoxylase-like metal-dependent hydrolase (beta-lactamase superfamily II)
MKNLAVTEIDGGTWQISECDEHGNKLVDAYLICGARRAILIDALCEAAGLYEKVKTLTGLPIDVLLTHGHSDHAGCLREFFEAGCDIYTDLREFIILETTCPGLAEESWFTPVSDGQKFELGGRTCEIISVPGHTPGSFVVIDRENEMLFSGDTIGSGPIWMQLPLALPLTVFEKNLRCLYKITSQFKNLFIYPGHRKQSPAQLNNQYIKDTLTVTQKLIEGSETGTDATVEFAGQTLRYKQIAFGMMLAYCYDPGNIK